MKTNDLAPLAFSIDEIIVAVRAALLLKQQEMNSANGHQENSKADLPEEDKGLPLADRRALSEAEAASYLGISVSSLRKQRMNGEREGHMPLIPWVRFGRRIVYLRDCLDTALESNRVQPANTTGRC